MLIQFNFKNYSSFKEEAVLDLSATKITEYNDRVVSICNEKILPVSAIYGANASGKSNVFNAFKAMTEYVRNSLDYGDEEKKFNINRPIPFLFDESTREAETCFEVYFTIPEDKKERVYNYGFCIDGDGVSEEWLNYKTKSGRKFKDIFYRSKDTLDLHGLPKKFIENIVISLNKQVLVVSLGAKLKVTQCKEIRDWFLNNKFADYGDVATSLVRERRLPQGFTYDKEVQKKVTNYLSSFDESIQGFKIEKVSHETDEGRNAYRISTLHKGSKKDELVELPLSLESSGTLKMFSLYPEMQKVLDTGGVFFVDELNARLHPLLVRNFILTFLNPKVNVNHAQLVFTTHDTWQLSNQLLRRDEIWFTEKDELQGSHLYSLADFMDEDGSKIRKDENYEKNYLFGKYGAIPTLKNINLKEVGNND